MNVVVVEWDCTVAETHLQRWVVREYPEPYQDEGYVVGPATRRSRANAVRLAAWLNEREGLS